MRQTVSEANKFLRQTVKSVEAGGVATLAQAMEHPGTLQEVHVTTLDAADAEIPAAAGLSEGVKLPTRIETKKLVIIGKFPVATQAEYDALSDAMKDKSVILDVNECPIGSEVKAIECNALGVQVDAHMWIMGADGWKGGSSSTLNPDGSFYMSGPLVAPVVRAPKANRNGAYKIHGGAKNSSSLDITNAAYSISEQHPALGEYWQYRIFAMNHDTVEKTMGVAKAAGAPTDKHSGSGLTWKTQQISSVDVANQVVPAATFVSATDQDVDDIAPAILPMDPVLASPVARTDSGTAADAGVNPLLLSRTLWVNGVRPLSALDPDWRTKTGLLFKAYGSSYDFVTSNASAAPTDSYAYQATFVEFSYVKPTLSILTDGDSTSTGVGTTSGKFAPIDEAARISRVNGSSKLVVPLKFASSGRRSAGFPGLLLSAIAAGLRPDVAVIQYWTVNDGSQAEHFAMSRAAALRMINICEVNGIIPILLTPSPYNGIGTGDRLDAWRAARSDALSFANQVLVCDMAEKVCDVNTAQFFTGMSGDGTHYNDVSTPIIGDALHSTIKKIL